MKAIIITIPPDSEPQDMSLYVAHVSQELANGMTSGHTNRDLFWSVEEVPDIEESVGA